MIQKHLFRDSTSGPNPLGADCKAQAIREGCHGCGKQIFPLIAWTLRDRNVFLCKGCGEHMATGVLKDIGRMTERG